VGAAASWWDPAWSARQEIVVSYTGSTTIDDYQVYLKVPYDSAMKSDQSDMRFVQDTGSGPQEIPHWTERTVSGSYALVWVKLKMMVHGDNSIFVYFGNPSSDNYSDGAQTFAFFDDFKIDSTAMFNSTNWHGATGNQHAYTYWMRDKPQEAVLAMPGRIVWRMRMTQYRLSNWGTAHWWGFRQDQMTVSPGDEQNLLELGIYCNSDTGATSEHPTMQMDSIRDGATGVSTGRTLVPIDMNKEYTYQLAATESKSYLNVRSDEGSVLFNPTLNNAPSTTNYLFTSHFTGIYATYGTSTLTWNSPTELAAYSATQHVDSHMEFKVDYILYTKYVNPEPTYVIKNKETNIAIVDFVSISYTPIPAQDLGLVTIKMDITNTHDMVASYDLEVRVGPRMTNWTQVPLHLTANGTLAAKSSKSVTFQWTAIGGAQRAWAILYDNMRGYVDIDVNRPPRFDPNTVVDQSSTAGAAFCTTVKASDPDGDSITWSVAQPEFTLTQTSPGVASLKLGAADAIAGVHRVDLKVEDGKGGYDKAQFYIILNGSGGTNNHPPVFDPATTTDRTAPADNELNLTVKASDPDGDVLYWSVDNLLFKYYQGTPNELDLSISAADAKSGIIRLTITVIDGKGGIAQASFNVSFIPGMNRPPQFISAPVINATVGTQYQYDALATDKDHDNLTYSLKEGPAGMTIDPKTGRVSWTPTLAQLGQNHVLISVTDGQAFDHQAFDITVQKALMVTIDRPLHGATVWGTINFTGTYEGPANTMVKIKFDGSVWHNTTTYPNGTWSYTKDTRSMSKGIHTVWVMASDGNQGSSAKDRSFIVDQSGGAHWVPPKYITYFSEPWWLLVLALVIAAVVGVGIRRYLRKGPKDI
jgi:hypothetical protein